MKHLSNVDFPETSTYTAYKEDNYSCELDFYFQYFNF